MGRDIDVPRLPCPHRFPAPLPTYPQTPPRFPADRCLLPGLALNVPEDNVDKERGEGAARPVVEMIRTREILSISDSASLTQNAPIRAVVYTAFGPGTCNSFRLPLRT